MSWIEDLHKERVFKYSTQDEIIEGTLQELAEMVGQTVEGVPGECLLFDGKDYTYAGFESTPTNQMSLVMYEQNGRKAYKIKDASGKIRYIAKSKHDYLKHGEIDGKKLKRKGKATPLTGEPE